MTDKEQPLDEAMAEGTVDFVPDTDGTTEQAEAPAEPTVEQRLAAAEDRALRLQAELQNVLNRKSRELADERKYGALPLVRDLLPALDNIDRALEAAEKGSDPDSGLLEGFKLVRQQIVTLLAQHGCEPIATDGADFDPELHEAILQQPSPDHPTGKIVMATQAGYRLHERVVRPAQVIVSSGAPE